jgi:hypothetical protein
MNCPLCNAEMAVRLSDVTENSQTGDKYDRTVLTCGADDSWVTVETPHRETVPAQDKKENALTSA